MPACRPAGNQVFDQALGSLRAQSDDNAVAKIENRCYYCFFSGLLHHLIHPLPSANLVQVPPPCTPDSYQGFAGRLLPE